MSAIRDIIGYELLDSRGNPTVGCKVITESGFEGFAIVPSGASVGKFEAFELRDGDKKRYFGKGVKQAIENIEGPLLDALRGKDVFDSRDIDETMIRLDGTENKSHFGANAMLAVSMAVARCGANAKDLELYQYLGNDQVLLPTPMMNIINGGVHADNNLNFQEFMIIPHGFNTFAEKIRAGSEVFHTLKKNLKSKGLVTSVGDEGGFAPNLSSNEEALDLIVRAINETCYQPLKQISISLDCAASNFYSDNGYLIEKNHPEKKRSSDEQISYLKTLIHNYPITSIEDGLDENDWNGWQSLTRECNSIQIVGDDIFVTNKKFLEKGIKNHCANSILIKLNQIGTVTETLDTIAFAKKHHYSFIISHRSGDTEDSFIADLAVATGASFIKTGSMSRSERISKYNRLLEIEKNTYTINNPNPQRKHS
jgi:enolase